MHYFLVERVASVLPLLTEVSKRALASYGPYPLTLSTHCIAGYPVGSSPSAACLLVVSASAFVHVTVCFALVLSALKE